MYFVLLINENDSSLNILKCVDDKPYWFDVEQLLAEYKPLSEEAFASLKRVGNEWYNEKIDDSEDNVKRFTKGKITLVSK